LKIGLFLIVIVIVNEKRSWAACPLALLFAVPNVMNEISVPIILFYDGAFRCTFVPTKTNVTPAIWLHNFVVPQSFIMQL